MLSGANWSNGADLGVFYRHGSYVASNSDRNYGARISSQSKPGQTAIARTVPRPLANGSYVASNSDRNYGARISSQSKPGQTAIARTVPRPLAKIARDGASE